ncbi:MAG: hypothetical protein GY938_13485 [Ketobacter sp.]|nr:hypothetical protein [Ketobacter sp.]
MGCNRCDVGYKAAKRYFSSDKFLCVHEDRAVRYLDHRLEYIDFCQNYGLQGSNVICAQCLKGFIPSLNYAECLAEEDYRGCIVADPEGARCFLCHPNLVKVDRHCEKPIIRHCKVYTNDHMQQLCAVCEDFFMLQDNLCLPGNVINCRVYNQGGECSVCDEFHFLINFTHSQYCNPINSDLNCLRFSQNNIQLSTLTCQQCTEGYALTNDQTLFSQDVCMNIRPIEHCLQYDISNSINSSSFMCTACEEHYYSSGYVCLERKRFDNNCKRYSLTHDFCVECMEGHFLSEDRECLKFPTGVRKCEVFASESECLRCQEGFFLQNNMCFKVEVSQQIANCLKYDSLQVCAVCLIGYRKTEEGLCEEMEAQNCLDYTEEGSCKHCPRNYGLKEDVVTGIINCVIIGLPNCKKSTLEYPFQCLECERYFYPIDGKCFPVEKVIHHCDIYQSDHECMQCEEGFTLNIENTVCNDEGEESEPLIKNCSIAKIFEEPRCQTCDYGHYLYDGECYVCETQSVERGCL